MIQAQALTQHTVSVGEALPWFGILCSLAFNAWMAKVGSDQAKAASEGKVALKEEAENIRRETRSEMEKIRNESRSEMEAIRRESRIEMEAIRKDVSLALKDFVTNPLATLRQEGIERDIEHVKDSFDTFKRWAEERLETNSKYIHTINNDLLKNFSGPIERINVQLMEKARRMAAFEERERATAEEIRDHGEEIREMTQRLAQTETCIRRLELLTPSSK